LIIISYNNNNNNKNNKNNINLIILSCPKLAKGQYLKIHDGVCVQLNFSIYMEIGVKFENNTGMGIYKN